MAMRLYWSSRSPFARKAMVVAHEQGLAARIECVPVVVAVTQTDAGLLQFNPLSQIPTLVLDDGRVVHDSLVVCEYLDAIGARPGLFPQAQARRLDALTRHALGQGMTEALVRLFGERKRDADPLQPTYVAALRAKFARAADALEQQCGHWTGRRVDIGDIGIACALAYAHFRFESLDWPATRPALRDWYDTFAQRPSMLATAFVAPPA